MSDFSAADGSLCQRTVNSPVLSGLLVTEESGFTGDGVRNFRNRRTTCVGGGQSTYENTWK